MSGGKSGVDNDEFERIRGTTLATGRLKSQRDGKESLAVGD